MKHHSTCNPATCKTSCIILFLAMLGICFGLYGCQQQPELSLGNVLILGDSYSTFEGYIPDGYVSWYTEDAGYTDVNQVNQTWWYQVIRRTKSTLLMNASYSGSTISHRGYHGEDYSEISFATRIDQLASSAYVQNTTVDTILIYGGLNDYWAGTELGSAQYDAWEESDLYRVLPAFSYLITSAKAHFPDARILFILEEDLGQEMKTGMLQICQSLQVEVITPHGIQKTESHPNAAGMQQLAQQILDYLKGD
jgi:lysophospholipase L1-like esterase